MDITKNLYTTVAKNKPSKEVAYIPFNYPAQKELKKRLKRKKETHLVRNILIIACILIFTIVALCVVNPGIKRQLWHYFEDTDFKAEITSEIHKIEAELSKHEYFKEFQTFIQEFKRNFKPSELRTRFENFVRNFKELLKIKQLYKDSNIFGMNKFMDWSKEERELLAGVRSSPPQGSNIPIPLPSSRVKRSIPSSFSWREHNKITPVKNQGRCGSCWAFAAVGVLETAWAIKNNSLLDLSEQNLVDCVANAKGCAGGWPPYALDYVKSFGIASEAAYSYKANQSRCHNATPKTFIADWFYAGDDETRLLTYLSTRGALIYTFYVPNSFYYIKKNTTDVYYPSPYECETAVNGHAVTVVGYGVENTTGYPYWLIKNSWGADWADEGFFKLHRGATTCAFDAQSWWGASATDPAWVCNDVDEEYNCKYWRSLGYCARTSLYYSHMKSFCKATCGFCSSG